MKPDQILKWKEEEQRQASVFYEAMRASVDAASMKLDAPLLNALAGASVEFMSFVILSAPSGKPRKYLREMMDRALVRRLRDGVDDARHHAQTIDMSKTHDH